MAGVLITEHEEALPLPNQISPSVKQLTVYIFAKHAENAAGKTGLPNAGAAADEGKQMKRWREIAGLDDESDE